MKNPEAKPVVLRDTTNVISPEDLDRHLHEFDTDLSRVERSETFNGLQLRQLRRSRGLNQVQLAELLGVTQPNVASN